VLLRNLVWAASYADQSLVARSTAHVDHLVDEIKQIGISHNVWSSKISKELEWTSLRGADKKKLIDRLPECIPSSSPMVTVTRSEIN
jgi:hypothetical protein